MPISDPLESQSQPFTRDAFHRLRVARGKFEGLSRVTTRQDNDDSKQLFALAAVLQSLTHIRQSRGCARRPIESQDRIPAANFDHVRRRRTPDRQHDECDHAAQLRERARTHVRASPAGLGTPRKHTRSTRDAIRVVNTARGAHHGNWTSKANTPFCGGPLHSHHNHTARHSTPVRRAAVKDKGYRLGVRNEYGPLVTAQVATASYARELAHQGD